MTTPVSQVVAVTGFSASEVAERGGLPEGTAVFRKPVDFEQLPPSAVFVGSDEKVSGTLQAREICRLMNGRGQVLVLMHGLCMNDLQWRRGGHDHGAGGSTDRRTYGCAYGCECVSFRKIPTAAFGADDELRAGAGAAARD